MARSKATLGVVSMLGACLLFAVMSAMIKWAAGLGVDAYKMALFRFAIGMALLGTLAIGKRIELRFFHSWLLFMRGLLGGAAIFLFYLAIDKVGIARGTVLSHAFPIFGAIAGSVFLKERVGVFKWGLILLAFVGIYLTAAGNGGILAGFSVYESLAVGSAILSGLVVVIIRKLRESESSFSIFFSQCTIGFWLMVIPANLTPVELGFAGGVLLVAIGLTAAGGQLLMTYAFAHVTVATGSLLNMLVPAINTVVGVMVFHEVLSGRMVVGIVLVISSCTLLVFARTKAEGVAVEGGRQS